MESEADHRRRLKGQKVSNPAGKKPCTDQQSLDQLYARSQDVRVLWVLQQRRLKKVATDLQIEVDIDSRVRASVSLIKETGRMSEKKSPLNTGLNRQALNKDLRNVCIADPGCVFIQRDLSGADSWTVAAECARGTTTAPCWTTCSPVSSLPRSSLSSTSADPRSTSSTATPSRPSSRRRNHLSLRGSTPARKPASTAAAISWVTTP
jgi:hypothetical protein